MNTITEKVSYVKGLADGLCIGDDAHGKLLKAIVDVLQDMAEEIAENTEMIDKLDECIDEIADECNDIVDGTMKIASLLECLEEAVYDDDDCDCDCDCDCDDFDDDDFVEVVCPHCNETVYFDEDMLENDDKLICPNCNEEIIPGCCDCGCGCGEDCKD